MSGLSGPGDKSIKGILLVDFKYALLVGQVVNVDPLKLT